MSFTFNPSEKWDVSTDASTLLPAGNHVCEIVAIEAGERTSSGDNPEIEVKVANDQGDIRDWIRIVPPRGQKKGTFGQFIALVLAAGVPEADWPKPGEDFDGNTGRVTQKYADKLLGRKVGVVVRPRQDKPDQVEVKGYVLPSEITDDMPADSRGLPNVPVGAGAGNSNVDDDIPF